MRGTNADAKTNQITYSEKPSDPDPVRRNASFLPLKRKIAATASA
jgi:hypothetical protein